MTVIMPADQIETIIDAHAHLASSRCIPRLFTEGTVENIVLKMHAAGQTVCKKSLYAMLEGSMQDHLADAYVAQMDKAGIQHAVLLLPDFTYALPGHDYTIEELYQLHVAVMARHEGRFSVFAAPDPRWGKPALDLLEKGVRDFGFSGIKLYPPTGYFPDTEMLYPYYELAEAYGIPVLFHTGGTSPAFELDKISPLLVEPAARKFPRVNFILAHAPISFIDEALILAKNRPNIFLDISGYASADAGSIRRVIDVGLNHKILFGSDWPVFKQNGSLATQIKYLNKIMCDESKLSEIDRALIMHGNAQRLLKKFGKTHVD